MRYKALIPSLVNLYVANNTMERTTALRDGLLALDTGDWAITKKDADRLLTVWASKESDPAASAIVGEIDSILAEFIETSAPTLVITDEMTEPIQHVHPVRTQPTWPCQAQKPVFVQAQPVFVEEAEEDEEQDTDKAMDVEEEVEVEEEAEEEEEEEEEEGMEVEKRKIRGVNYWYEEKTNKLYAIIGDDDVGDEVGVLLNGKPVLLASVA
jgi:hypothetical protein